MIDRAILLRKVCSIRTCALFFELTSCSQAINQFFEDYIENRGKNGAYFPELAKFKLAEREWSALVLFKEILEVRTPTFGCRMINSVNTM